MYNEEYAIYQKQVDRRRRVRMIVIITVILATILSTFAPLTQIDVQVWIYFHIMVAVLGTAGVFGVILYPYYFPIPAPHAPMAEVKTKDTFTGSFYESLPISSIIYISGPFALLFTGLTLYLIIANDFSSAIVVALVATFTYGMLFLFGKLEVWTDNSTLRVKLGMFREAFELSEIVVFRSVGINPRKDFVRYGKTTSADGSIGYITGVKTGIRVELKSGKTYVISSKKPQELVDLVVLDSN